MKFIFVFALLLALGCRSNSEKDRQPFGRLGHIPPGRVGSLTIGMSKAETLALLGPPESAAASADSETLFYVEEHPWWHWKTIAVKFNDGKLSQFGEKTQP
jgi:hypothetical protein